jgi:hypothetical protein
MPWPKVLVEFHSLPWFQSLTQEPVLKYGVPHRNRMRSGRPEHRRGESELVGPGSLVIKNRLATAVLIIWVRSQHRQQREQHRHRRERY